MTPTFEYLVIRALGLILKTLVADQQTLNTVNDWLREATLWMQTNRLMR